MPARPMTAGQMMSCKADLVSFAASVGSPMYISDRALLPERDVVQLVESVLKIPTLNNATEDHLVSCSTSEDGLVTDPDFPPTTASLYPTNAPTPQWALMQPSVWRRVNGALYVPSNQLPRLEQGCLLDHPFLGALSAVACYPDLLLDLIVSDDCGQAGCFTLQFYKHGCWHRVVVDNYLPCIEGEEKLAFSCSAHVGELWPSLIEKAYAKVHGDFNAIQGGSIADCLTDLTGGVATKIKLDVQPAPYTTGQLWHKILSWLAEGAIIACKAKPSSDTCNEGGEAVQDELTEGYGGVLLNQVYSIVGARELDVGRTRLLRIHCAWPAPGGVWQGSWAPGSPEWDSSPAAQQLAQESQDPACAWVPINELMAAFNRLYVCRRFPSSWHHLTLHCGWHGPSAGGPPLTTTNMSLTTPAQVPVPSSTWCCNPQFMLTVRKSCEVVITLGQADPRIASRGHVAKSARKRSIALTILSSKAAIPGRVWSIPQSGLDTVVEGTLTSAREQVLTFQAEAGTAYLLIPHTGRAGEEGAFVLRCYAGAPLEVEQLPSPLRLVVSGSWKGIAAGGTPSHPTWGSNPQYLLSASTKTKVVASVTRLDVKYAVLKPAPNPAQAVGMHLCTATRSSSEGLVAHRSMLQSPSEVVASSEYTDMQEATIVATLEPGVPYVLVPSLATPGLEAGYEVVLMSGVPLEMVPLPQLCTYSMQGSWREENAGGCDLAPTWRKNPRYLLKLSEPCKIKVQLCRAAPQGRLPSARPAGTSVEEMIGFYILQTSNPSGAIQGDMRSAVVFESAFTSMTESLGEHALEADKYYIVMPCKYGAGRLGRYNLTLSARAAFTLNAL